MNEIQQVQTAATEPDPHRIPALIDALSRHPDVACDDNVVRQLQRLANQIRASAN